MRYYMKIAGVTGGANYLGTDSWSIIESVDAKASRNIIVTKYTDFVSARMTLLAADGKHCPVVLIDFVDTIAGSNVRVKEMTLKDVVITKLTANAGTQIESYDLNYEDIHLEYYSIQPRPTISAVPNAPARRTWY